MRKKIVDVVVDMQNDFISGALGTKEGVAIVSAVVETVKDATKNGHLVLFTKDTHGENYLQTREGRHLPVKHCIKGTPGWDLVSELQEIAENLPYDAVIEKPTFGSDKLPEIIREFTKDTEIEKIRIYGVCTDICVTANAAILRTFFPETEMEVLGNCCACVTPETHQTAIETLKTMQFIIV